MGRPKALLDWHGQPFVVHLAEVLRAGGCTSVTVVGGADAASIQAALPAWVRFVAARDWAGGMRASLRAGLAALAPGPVVLTHADRPGVAVETVRALVAAPGERAVAPTYDGVGGHPVRLPAALRHRLLEADDVPLRDLLGPVCWVPVDDPAVLRNVNTPSDYAAALAREGAAERDG